MSYLQFSMDFRSSSKKSILFEKLLASGSLKLSQNSHIYPCCAEESLEKTWDSQLGPWEAAASGDDEIPARGGEPLWGKARRKV
jgi:hypothetical protein